MYSGSNVLIYVNFQRKKLVGNRCEDEANTKPTACTYICIALQGFLLSESENQRKKQVHAACTKLKLAMAVPSYRKGACAVSPFPVRSPPPLLADTSLSHSLHRILPLPCLSGCPKIRQMGTDLHHQHQDFQNSRCKTSAE